MTAGGFESVPAFCCVMAAEAEPINVESPKKETAAARSRRGISHPQAGGTEGAEERRGGQAGLTVSIGTMRKALW
jgi:hypothetical protein